MIYMDNASTTKVDPEAFDIAKNIYWKTMQILHQAILWQMM